MVVNVCNPSTWKAELQIFQVCEQTSSLVRSYQKKIIVIIAMEKREKEISRMHSCKHVHRRGMKTEGGLSEGSKETCERDGKK